ncbi:hypothetical protein NQ318_019375 [Aromia moschata]|uniref:Uncharacterized protein n=1 Tax=Aromia moschata TaxID=1265417 RepID=A0AAV8XNN2_9CUCU|nr:hypothetical protein NQ318_019375 [Aromia moschata]
MSGSPIPDVRHSVPFAAFLRPNYTDFLNYQDVTTTIYPVYSSPETRNNSGGDGDSDQNPREINSFYFYKKMANAPGTPKTITVDEDGILIRVSENPGNFENRNARSISLYSGSAVIASRFTSSPTIYSASTKYASQKPRFSLPMRRHLLDGEFLIGGTIICGIPRIYILIIMERVVMKIN